MIATKSVTGSFAGIIHGLTTSNLTQELIQRSKRMILDTLGVGLIGTTTEVFHKALQYSKIYSTDISSTVWGHPDLRLPPLYASFVNGVAVHSMDFDDTWHPATHPSGAILPSLIALSETLPSHHKKSGLDFLLAFNVGIEVQGRLMRFSNEASNIPRRFHPPAVVGTMGSAAASSKFLGLDQVQCREALAIAASYSGAPMANAGTQTKPLHIESYNWLLEKQDVAIKRFPAHLGMHWVADAACEVRKHIAGDNEPLVIDNIQKIVLRIPEAKYVSRPLPSSEHEARHSFQFNACTALLDGLVSVQSFSDQNISRPELQKMLSKIEVLHPSDNQPNFEKLYCEVSVTLTNGATFTERCNTFYGHWRKPLSNEDLIRKFRSNALTVLSEDGVDGIVEMVNKLEDLSDFSELCSFLRQRGQAISKQERSS
ncbi:unnamed protein product [Ranitomeya imitator]|uniref:Cis-aconitate decarboxylase n=1 Tax=Ranitomeya imitator TaxID=111125 RepID=A0ABN9M8P1_9NEOB|nr:unnamed protein product [Ranitomeya imitator]